MKIQAIGTGSMWNEYNSSCYLVDDEILIDIPNGTCKNLYKTNIKPTEIKHILITHFHGDHFFDIPFYLLQIMKMKNKCNIYCSKEGNKKIRSLFKLAFPNTYKKSPKDLIDFNNNEKFKINNYNVFKILLDHGNMKPAFGYIFDNSDIKVGFTGDTCLCDNVKEMAKICNYLICDCMFINGTKKHQGIDNMMELKKLNDKCKIIVTHLENDTRKYLEENKIENIIVPNDYDIFNF